MHIAEGKSHQKVNLCVCLSHEGNEMALHPLEILLYLVHFRLFEVFLTKRSKAHLVVQYPTRSNFDRLMLMMLMLLLTELIIGKFPDVVVFYLQFCCTKNDI